jgi:hypothetical protein
MIDLHLTRTQLPLRAAPLPPRSNLRVKEIQRGRGMLRLRGLGIGYSRRKQGLGKVEVPSIGV